MKGSDTATFSVRC